MNSSATINDVRGWPVEDQLELVYSLWDQIIDTGWQPTPSPELLAELQRRLNAYAADPTRALTWEQVVEHVRRAR